MQFCPHMYDSGWECIHDPIIIGGDYFILFNMVQHLSGNFVVFYSGGSLMDCQNVGYLGIDPGGHQGIYFPLLYHIHYTVFHRGSQDHGNPSCEVRQIQDYLGFLILIITLDSIYLTQYDDVA